jgi:hypothetical protein
MALAATVLFGVALSGTELLSARAGRYRALVVVGVAVACPLVVTVGWNWVQGLLEGGTAGAWRAVSRLPTYLWGRTAENLGIGLALALPFLGIILARLWGPAASPGRRLAVTAAVALVAGGLSFYAFCALAAEDFREPGLRLVLTVGTTVATALGLQLGDVVERRVRARRAAAD